MGRKGKLTIMMILWLDFFPRQIYLDMGLLSIPYHTLLEKVFGLMH